MSTYKLWELANHSRAEIHILAQQVVDTMVKDWDVPSIREDTWGEEAQSLVYVVHSEMWHMGKPKVVSDHPPYTHVIKNIDVPTALRKAVPNIDKDFSSLTLLIRSIYAILSDNQLLIRVGTGKAQTFYIREWPKGWSPHYAPQSAARYLPYRERLDIEKQAKKADDLAGEVVKYRSVKLLGLPGDTPESIIAYVRKLIPLAIALEKENVELRDRLLKLEQTKWAEVKDEIEQLVME